MRIRKRQLLLLLLADQTRKMQRNNERRTTDLRTPSESSSLVFNLLASRCNENRSNTRTNMRMVKSAAAAAATLSDVEQSTASLWICLLIRNVYAHTNLPDRFTVDYGVLDMCTTFVRIGICTMPCTARCVCACVVDNSINGLRLRPHAKTIDRWLLCSNVQMRIDPIVCRCTTFGTRHIRQ